MSGLGRLTSGEIQLISIFIEGLFWGLYSAIFFMYIQCQASKEVIDKTRSILLYPVCVLYILSTVTFAIDIPRMILSLEPVNLGTIQVLVQQLYASVVIIGLCDFISQAILIYRCWVLWGRNTGVIITPSILALAFLATWFAGNSSTYIVGDEIFVSNLEYRLLLTSLSISLIVNAGVTGLIVLRIFKVYWEVRRTSEDQTLGVGGTTPKLWSIICIIIESGMTMFAIQLIRVVLSFFQPDAVSPIIAIYQMLNGITPTIILVRVSTGLSYHDEKSMVETAGSLWFASNNQDSTSGTGDVDIMGQEQIDDIGIQQGDNQNPISGAGGIDIAGQERIDNISIRQGDEIEVVDR